MDKLQKNREMVSALVDGHLRGEDFACAVEVTIADADARSAWHAYHLVGDVLRSSDPMPCVASEGFMARFQQRLAAEACHGRIPEAQSPPQVLSSAVGATARGSAANAPVFRWKLVAGFASFAAVTAVAWMSLSGAGLGGTGGNGAQLASLSQPRQAADMPARGWVATSSSGPVAEGGSDVAAVNGSAVMIRDPHLDALLGAHKQFGGTSALQGPSGFLRNATFETPGR